MQGLKYDVQTSDGAWVGFNRDSTTENEIIYTWYADKEGVYSFQDMGDTRSSEEGTNIHGLFGAIIVEEAESVWLDPETGAELSSGLFADIYHPTHPAFREYAVFFHDELEIKDKDGTQPDGTVIPPLQPLKDRIRPPKKDEMHLGYPNFIEGTVGEAPLQPPLGVLDLAGNVTKEPTELEKANFVENFEPGIIYSVCREWFKEFLKCWSN